MKVNIDLDKIFYERGNFSEVLYLATSTLLNEDVLDAILFGDERNRLKELLKNVDLQSLQELAEYIAYNSAQCE